MRRLSNVFVRMTLAVPALVLVATIGASRVAHADEKQGDKQACVDAYEAGQKDRQDGKLRASREAFVKCASDACPQALRKDCAPWLREVEDAMPTVVLAAKDPTGHDLVDVRVRFDGQPLAERLDGRAVEVDPGVHVLRFETSGALPIEERVVIREGQKLRVVQVTFAPPPPSAPAPAPLPDDGPSRPVPVASWVLAGVGVLGVGGFAYFGATGLTQKSDLDKCRGSCAQSDVDAAKRSFLFADVSLTVGVVALATAGYLFFTRPAAMGTTTGRGFVLDVAASRGGGVASVHGAF